MRRILDRDPPPQRPGVREPGDPVQGRGRVVAVGTTVVRALESAARDGRLGQRGPSLAGDYFHPQPRIAGEQRLRNTIGPADLLLDQFDVGQIGNRFLQPQLAGILCGGY